MDDKTLKKLQAVETEMLVVVDKFCRDNNIKYSLYAGTALGAVRHGGFIPWDDDIDICMERSEYDRFLKLWREKGPEGYFLQGTDIPEYEHISFSKVRKENTLFGTEHDVKLFKHNGIFVDVFPYDKVPKDKKLRKKYFRDVKLWMIYTRGYPYKKGSKFLELISRVLLLIPRKKQLQIRNKLQARIFKYNMLDKDYDLMFLACPADLKIVYPEKIFDEVIDVSFEQKTVSLHKNYDEILKIKFGDYMQLPPPEERVCRHEPVVLDFGE